VFKTIFNNISVILVLLLE